jgi:polyphosphate kinase
MRELGVWEKCRYPSFSPEVPAQFSALAEDLRWADDFIHGSASTLKRAAEVEAARAAKQDQEAMYAYSGDPALIREMRDLLRQRKYKELLRVEQQLRYPERIEESVRRMIALARKRAAQK